MVMNIMIFVLEDIFDIFGIQGICVFQIKLLGRACLSCCPVMSTTGSRVRQPTPPRQPGITLVLIYNLIWVLTLLFVQP